MADDQPKALWDMTLDEMEKLKYDDILETMRLDETLRTLNRVVELFPSFPMQFLQAVELPELITLRDNLAVLQTRRNHAREAVALQATEDAADDMAAIAKKRLGVTEFESVLYNPSYDHLSGQITVKATYKTKDGRSYVVQMVCYK